MYIYTYTLNIIYIVSKFSVKLSPRGWEFSENGACLRQNQVASYSENALPQGFYLV